MQAVVKPWIVKSWVITKTGLWYAGVHGVGIKGIKRCQFFVKASLHKVSAANAALLLLTQTAACRRQ